MNYLCCNERRRSAVLANPAMNGIDYLEVVDHAAGAGVPRQCTLLVHCLNPLAAVPVFGPAPDGAGTPYAATAIVEGGESITAITVDWIVAASAINNTSPPDIRALLPLVAALADPDCVLVVRTHEAGDFSPYRLRLVTSAAQAADSVFDASAVPAPFDLQLAEVTFSFKVECGPDFDCAPLAPDCAPAALAPPPINYLAKDYASFRTLIIDRMSQLLPGWNAGSEADAGIALAELIAYAGDHLSYQQDAVATEAYLETARRRVSLRRHALLVDYHVHDGCNARAWIALQTDANAGVAVFVDRDRSRFYTFAPGMPKPLAGNEEAALLSGVQVFEPMHDTLIYAEHNQMRFYTWGDTGCCLPRNATEATLLGAYPNLKPGDVLIFAEVKGPQTSNPADADIRHRCAVRLTHVGPFVDALLRDSSGNPLQVTEIQWAQADALPFPVCISSTWTDASGDTQSALDVSVAYGNIVLADHGLSFTGRAPTPSVVPPPRLYYPRDPAADRCNRVRPVPLQARFAPRLADSPLTQAVPLAIVPLPAAGTPVTNAPVPLDAAGGVELQDANGYACLALQATDPLTWPPNFSVVAQANAADPTHFDLTVQYSPPGGPAGIASPVALEKFANLSPIPGNPDYAATRINAQSRLINVPAGSAPPAGPVSGFAASAVPLSNTVPLTLYSTDTPPTPYLQLRPANPSGWPRFFAVTAQPDAVAGHFDLSLVYDPPAGGLGVAVPVVAEAFARLLLSGASGALAAYSTLVRVEGFAQAPDPAMSAADLMNTDARAAVPAITLAGTTPDGAASRWYPLQELLESGESDTVFVVEVEADGTASLRFGDDVNGRVPETGTVFTAAYRIGNASAGNVGPNSLIHLEAADARIVSCRNPLPAAGGVEPETTEQIRRRAPQAFLIQERAVTMADYAATTERDPQVDRAAASLRWTGSWYTAFVAVDPKGGGNLTPALRRTLIGELERYRLAGQDLDFDSPQYVSLDIELTVCVNPNYFQADVLSGLKKALASTLQCDGQKGLFHPDNFTFGQTVYLGPVYAAARKVPGVLSVTATVFQPQGASTPQHLEAGEIKLRSLQVARLDNDPSYPDHGQLTLVMEGRK
ncbi:putative baseplate assembly protein [Paraburkholderia fungorum]|uniref:putative baseplate assembly protein n=1 Tax=Paraburkholderia fungorum TaxID=134537 RepID=UPI0038B92FF6